MAAGTTSEDLDAAFAAHADEALAIAKQALPAAAEAWNRIGTYAWGESVGADRHGVIVPLNVGSRWAADLVLGHGQARELAEQLLDVTSDSRTEAC